ncbi:hypothetical protein [Noviherbaspirillum pedocola]|uniref:Uncharacterized protein n=1 Tax=Noviherbaspirillum pedocola TaxID=2801341 RepID=A0A934W8A5_9BURK|nr:hypothetical protein [Noviherbaspirillum pedocola]MBK4737350.1 hypothetical protein [Noviherbaspirillum pedocola]
MTIPVGVIAAGGELAFSAITKGIMVLYNVTSEFNNFVDEHIEKMTKSENVTIARTGKVIEGAKLGFGIGYIVPVAIIAAGQLILGNKLQAISVIASAATISNPVAMTCAAVGAIYYGWTALSTQEQGEILRGLSVGLEVGVELLKSIISFVIGKTKELLSAENIKEMKRFINDAAASFGRSLADVTGAIKDRVSGIVDTVTKSATDAGQKVIATAAGASHTVIATATEAGQAMIVTVGNVLPSKRRENSTNTEK